MIAKDKGLSRMPIVETTRDVIDYFNKDKKSQFDQAGYFVLENVVVCESGKKDLIERRMDLFHDCEPYELQMRARDGEPELAEYLAQLKASTATPKKK